MTDVWAPWAACDRDALGRVFELQDFEAQCRALLELAPKASARDLSLLPWDEQHDSKEFRRIAGVWRGEREARREAEKQRDEEPLPEAVRKRFEACVRIGDMKGAKDAFTLMQQIAQSMPRDAEQAPDDFAKLTDAEVIVLAALCHKLREEPITDVDAAALKHLESLDASYDRSVE